MKTIYTTLPIYDKLSKQCFQRSKTVLQSGDKPIAIVCPRHRLPSFQWVTPNHMGTVTKIEMINTSGTVVSDLVALGYFPAGSLPTEDSHTAGYYYSYKGETLKLLLPTGIYYLKITTEHGYILYSEYFKVDCVYENLLTEIIKFTYDDLTVSTTIPTVIAAANSEGNDAHTSDSNHFTMTKGESVKIIFWLEQDVGQNPTVYISNSGWTIDDSEEAVAGLNEITLTATWDGDTEFHFGNDEHSHFHTGEILVIREYSTKYLTINFHNDCDLGDILYHSGFDQSLWFESETMEQTYPQEDEGVKNGEGQFVSSFARQVKKYLARTKAMPDYMADVFNRLKLHDTVTLIDLVGDSNTVSNLEVEHEWLWDDKYYAKFDLTFDYDEAVVMAGCCNDIV